MQIQNWGEKEGKIQRTYEFEDFIKALEFVNKVGELAEEATHHPDISIHDYKRVTLTLTTHSAGGLTDKDFNLAQKVNELITA